MIMSRLLAGSSSQLFPPPPPPTPQLRPEPPLLGDRLAPAGPAGPPPMMKSKAPALASVRGVIPAPPQTVTRDEDERDSSWGMPDRSTSDMPARTPRDH